MTNPVRAFALLFAALLYSGCEYAFSSNAAAGTFSQRPKTYEDFKYANSVRQERDFTCGAAALATILKYHYDMPITEDMIFSYIVKRYSVEELKQKAKEGFSFEDLIFAAKKLGFNAQAGVVKLDDLRNLTGPVIIQLDMKDNDHFVVLRKVVEDVAYLSDPIFGNVTMEHTDFAKKFRGPVLAIWPSYLGKDYNSVLSIIRDPISVQSSINRALNQPTFGFQRVPN